MRLSDAEFALLNEKIASIANVYCRHNIDPRDLCQSAWLRVLSDLPGFSAERASNDIGQFVIARARFGIRDALRKTPICGRGRRGQCKDIKSVPLDASKGSDPTVSLEKQIDARNLLKRARLSVRERSALRGRFVDGLSQGEIASVMHLTTGRIYQIQTEALWKLRDVVV